MTRSPADLEAIESRLWSLLEPYRAELEDATIYGIPSLRWPGAKAHDYFASVKQAKSHVSLFLLVADTYPEALEGTPPTLIKRRSGKAAFNFPSLEPEMARDLEALLARLYARYRADHASPNERIVIHDDFDAPLPEFEPGYSHPGDPLARRPR